MLAPEAYLPLRLVGTSFHASAEGLSAADQVFEVLERPMPEHGNRAEVPDPATHAVTIDRVTVAYPGRTKPAIEGCSLTIEPGEAIAITGPSGCGKSTLVSVLLGFVTPSEGAIRVGDVDLVDDRSRGVARAHRVGAATPPPLRGVDRGEPAVGCTSCD